jgi:hypothetical protein
MADESNSLIVSFLPFLILSIPLAWGNYYLASRTGRSGVLYVILTLIPVIGNLVTIYLFYRAVLFAVDRTRGAMQS